MASSRSRVSARHERVAVIGLGLVFLTGILPTADARAVEPVPSTAPVAVEPGRPYRIDLKRHGRPHVDVLRLKGLRDGPLRKHRYPIDR